MAATLVAAYALALTLQTAPQASVEGVIRDVGTGVPLPGATVMLTDLDQGAVSGPDGRYELRFVPPGPQHLTVQHLGYSTRTLHLLVPASGRLGFDVSLHIDPIAMEGILVARNRPIRGLDPGDSTAFPDRGVTHAGLETHPTLAQADALMALAGGEIFMEAEAPTGVHMRGGASDQTGYLLDGVPVLNPLHAAGLFSAWNPDALAGLHVAGVATSPGLPDALSGAIFARTREPGNRLRMQSALSNTQARLTVDGPVGVGGAAYLLSWRSGISVAFARADEASYVSGETGDFVGKIQMPAFGGGLRFLLYDSENELGTASAVRQDDATEPTAPRNTFEWASRSFGASWAWSRRAREPALPMPHATGVAESDLAVLLGVWGAAADAGSSWSPPGDAARLANRRWDFGFGASAERRSSHATTQAGVRFRSIKTSYNVHAERPPHSWEPHGTTGVLAVFAQHARPLGSSLDLRAGAAASFAGGELRLAPRAQLRWQSAGRLVWTAAYSRSHQFAQSLRNPESVAGHVFPVELFLASGVAGVPVPESDQIVVAGEWTAPIGLRLGAQAYTRRMKGVLLVAPRETGPFATDSFAVGAATARGASIEVASSGARYGIIASYGLQRVRLGFEPDSAFTPHYGITHTLDAGVVVFPSGTSSVRLSVQAAAGRTATALSGPFEWESCNVLDVGCEFAGSPRLEGPLGRSELPAYGRVDLGARKHWHLTVSGRDILFGVAGTLTNLLGRRNTLNYILDPETGDEVAIDMLPLSPLVVGIDARF